MSHACQCFWNCYKTLTFCSLVTRCTIPSAYHAKRHLNVQKCSRTLSFFALLTSKCASRHNGVHFFDISTSKSGPTLVCFVHFDFNMCFAPQRRALFRHHNFKKWSDPGVLCTFWLRNVLRATTACNLSSLIWPNGSAPAALASLLFRPSGATNHCKNTMFRDFPTFSRICIFFLLTLSLLWSSLFYSSLLSDSSHLCFSSVHIVGSLTSKLPSIRNVFQVTWRRSWNVSGRFCKLLEDDSTTYQERLASYLTKTLQHIRNTIQVASRCENVSGPSCKLLAEDFSTYQEHLQVTWM